MFFDDKLRNRNFYEKKNKQEKINWTPWTIKAEYKLLILTNGDR